MPTHIVVDETASEPVSLGSSATSLSCVRLLVGYTLAAVECEFILQTLRYFRGNRTRAADALGISIRSLRDKIRIYRERGDNVPAPQPSNADHLLHEKPSALCH